VNEGNDMTDQNKGSDMEQHTQENDNGNFQSTEINDRDSDGWSDLIHQM